jgi:hypothetical protein
MAIAVAIVALSLPTLLASRADALAGNRRQGWGTALKPSMAFYLSNAPM